MQYVKSLDDVSDDDIYLAGGKAMSLANLKRNNVPVPPGFVILSQAYRAFGKSGEFPDHLKDQVLQYVKKFRNALFAVRSSASLEDSSSSSWAGQLESFLNIGREGVFEAIQKCWSSVSALRVRDYIQQLGLADTEVQMAVIVQRMVSAKVAGVCFTAHPVLNDNNLIFIEVVRGLGEPLVQGKIAGDTYIVDKDKMIIVEKNISCEARIEDSGFSDEHILILSRIAKDIENIYSKPQDIEWAFDGKKFFIVQSRPITTI